MTDNKWLLDKPILDVKDIQVYLGIGRGQAFNLANSGAFHVVRIGRRIKIPTSAFLTWLNGA
ncbi:helix-turn-helix domain-containing protein [Bacillus sp. FJAT-27251]|uniref:helix-turn-helix domain-containing protein n=1 Tax=Bacillus sp. FJAT-27251 TaxID=1684142 RepID=UPI0006A7E49A|nr:helix-turn-helix domain-containing protein [Bacillus sp. FJAT-27251]